MVIWETMIPLHYNDGTKIAQTVRAEALFAVGQLFGGYTLDAVSEGCYGDKIEPMQRLWVACPENQLDAARSVVNNIGVLLKQRVMLFVVSSPEVQFMRVKS